MVLFRYFNSRKVQTAEPRAHNTEVVSKEIRDMRGELARREFHRGRQYVGFKTSRSVSRQPTEQAIIPITDNPPLTKSGNVA